jgi:hypothetical protein
MKTRVVKLVIVFFSTLFSSCSKSNHESNLVTADKVYLFNAGEVSVFANEDGLSANSISDVLSKKELTYFNIDTKSCLPISIPDGIRIMKDGVIKHATLAYVINGKTAFVYFMKDGKLKSRYLSESTFNEISKETLKYLKPGVNVLLEE